MRHDVAFDQDQDTPVSYRASVPGFIPFSIISGVGAGLYTFRIFSPGYMFGCFFSPDLLNIHHFRDVKMPSKKKKFNARFPPVCYVTFLQLSDIFIYFLYLSIFPYLWVVVI